MQLGQSSRAFPQEELEKQKEKYLSLFMLDFLEFNMRKVASENAQFCAQNCDIFKDLDKPSEN